MKLWTFSSHAFQVWLNDYTSPFGIGAFHSGTEVHGRGEQVIIVFQKLPLPQRVLECSILKCPWHATHSIPEYAYGGHPYSYTGVYDTEPKQAAEVAGEGVRFKESLLVGTTMMSLAEVREVIHRLGKQYNGNTYHILNKWAFWYILGGVFGLKGGSLHGQRIIIILLC